MSKVAVVYWSGTGNTETMAEFIADGVKENGNDAVIFTAGEFNSSNVSEFDAIAFGCPSMGSEELEESEFEPMFSSVESSLGGKKIALFGSYGWGDGEWMRNWEERVSNLGVTLTGTLIVNETPDDDAKNECISLGKTL